MGNPNQACDGVQDPKNKPVRPGKGFVVPRSAIFGYHLGQFEGYLGNVDLDRWSPGRCGRAIGSAIPARFRTAR